MTRALCAVVVCAFVVCSLTVNAQEDTGNELLKRCQKYVHLADLLQTSGLTGKEKFADGLAFGVCAGQVQGVKDMSVLWQASSSDTALACLPDDLSTIQAVKVFIKYLEDNPANLHLRTTGLVWLSLIDAFPCTEGE